MTENREQQHEVVFGQSFARYDSEQMADFVRPFQTRFDANSLDATETFSGKRCLDAGCGTGRGSIFMMEHGAAHVTAVDVSETNTKSAARNLSRFGEGHFESVNSSLEKLPFDDESFDFVWCYGVIQHTAEPDKCLQEITRVLKKNGKMFLFVYGSGGLYWYAIQRFREVLASIDADVCFNTLSLMGHSLYDFTTFMDDWKAAYLRCYTHQDFMTRLQELGFENEKPLPYGTSHDLNHRLNTHSADADWVGEGDLRYLLTKTGSASTHNSPISADEHGSDYEYDAHLLERFKKPFDVLQENVAENPILAIQACAFVQGRLLPLMADEGPLNVAAFEDCLQQALLLTTKIRSGL